MLDHLTCIIPELSTQAIPKTMELIGREISEEEEERARRKADHNLRKDRLESCTTIAELRACTKELGISLAKKRLLNKVVFRHLIKIGSPPTALADFLSDTSLNRPGRNLAYLIAHLRKEQSYSISDVLIFGSLLDSQLRAGYVKHSWFRDMLESLFPTKSSNGLPFMSNSRDWHIFSAIWIGALKSPNLKVGHKYLSSKLNSAMSVMGNEEGRLNIPASTRRPKKLDADTKLFVSLCVQCILKEFETPPRDIEVTYNGTQLSSYFGPRYFLGNLRKQLAQGLIYEINREVLEACRKDVSGRGWEHQRLRTWFSMFTKSERFSLVNKSQLLNHIKSLSSTNPVAALAVYCSCYPIISRNENIRQYLLSRLRRVRGRNASLHGVFIDLLMRHSKDYPVSAFDIYLCSPRLRSRTHCEVLQHILSNPSISPDAAFTMLIRHYPNIRYKERMRKPVHLTPRQASILHAMATTYASAEHLTARQALRKVLRCARYFRDNTRFVKPQLSVAIAMAGIVRYWKAGRWPSLAQVQLVLSVIQEIEGAEVADEVDSLVRTWREEYNLVPEHEREWLRHSASAFETEFFRTVDRTDRKTIEEATRNLGKTYLTQNHRTNLHLRIMENSRKISV